MREKEQGCLYICDAHVCIGTCEREGRGEEGCVCDRGEEGGEGETDRTRGALEGLSHPSFTLPLWKPSSSRRPCSLLLGEHCLTSWQQLVITEHPDP